MNQEQIMQLQMIEHEANQLNHQFQLIEQNINEMQKLDESLTAIDNIEKTENEEILIDIGKKIFVPVKIKEKNLVVDVGNKNFVKKNISETKVIIEDQIKKLIAAKTEIMERLQDLEMNMNQIIQNINSEREKGGKHKHKHKHDHTCNHNHKHKHDNCECGDDCKCED
jgi:prefoldin alpha subunit